MTTYAVIRNDAPDEDKKSFQVNFDQLIQDLGLQDPEIRQDRIKQMRSFVDEIFAFSEEFIKRNPELKD